MHKLKKVNLNFSWIIAFSLIVWGVGIYLLAQILVCRVDDINCFNIASLANWDGQHFLLLAENGYIYPYQLAFFPLFPLLIKLSSLVLPLSLLINGLLLNWLFTLVAFIFLYKLLKLDFSIKDSRWIILLIICFPLSFFYLVIYSESLFFCLSVLTFFCYKKKKYWLSIIFLTLLTLTRMAGLALVVAILLDIYFQKKPLDWFLIPFSGVGLFAFYGYFKTGILLSIVYAETHWERIVTLPGYAIYNSLLSIFREGISYKNYAILIDLVLVLIILIVLIRSYKLLPRLYFHYAAFSLLIPLSTSTFISLPRFVLVIFPLFIAFYAGSNTIFRVLYCVIGFSLTIYFLNLFLQGSWIS